MLEKLLEQLLITVINKGGGALQKRLAARKSPAPTVVEASPDAKDAPIVIGEVATSGGAHERMGTRGRRRSSLGTLAPGTPLSLTLDERKRHVYILGKTGTGKTVLQTSLFLADVAAGRGVALVDYRGDLMDRALLFLADRFTPEELSERLVILDLRENAPFSAPDEPIVCFNPLTECGGDPYTSAFFVLDLLRQQWGDLGVQMQETLRNALLALALTGGTLAECEPLLTDAPFRKRVLAAVTDASVVRFFERFDALGTTGQLAWTLPVLNKMSVYFSRPRLWLVLGAKPDNTGKAPLSFREVLDSRPDRILLVCLGADQLFKTAGLVGNAVTGAIARAFMRADRDAKSRATNTLHLLLDEFENTATASAELFEEVLAEARRYGLYATFAHQATDQLPARLRTLLRNLAATHVYFALGGTDCDTVAGELPSEEPRAVIRCLLANQAVGNALLVRPGQPLVRMKTHYIPEPRSVTAEKIAALRAASMARWGMPLQMKSATPLPAVATPSTPVPAPVVEVRDVPESVPKQPRRRLKKQEP